MKNRVFASIAVLLSLTVSTICMAETQVVQVLSVKVRGASTFMGPSLGELKYKQEVAVLAEKGAFLRIRSGQLEGWIPKSAVTTAQRFKLREGNRVELSHSGSMAAGKGLNVVDAAANSHASTAKIEGEKAVDFMEADTPEHVGDLDTFVSQGGLKPGKRGAQSR